jgi:N-acetylmuramoyl-L-alanine amidase
LAVVAEVKPAAAFRRPGSDLPQTPKATQFQPFGVTIPGHNSLSPLAGDGVTGVAAVLHRVVLAGVLWLAALGAAGAATSGPRRHTIDGIIVHAISGPYCEHGRLAFSGAPGDAERWKKFFDRHPFLGIHYVVDREGVVLASTPEDRVANHALDSNETTVGIELVHDGDGREPFSGRQIAALIDLLRSISERHRVAIDNIKGHSDVDLRTFTCGGQRYKTKMDPGANFPWAYVRAHLRGEPPRLVATPAPAVRPHRASAKVLGAPSIGQH